MGKFGVCGLMWILFYLLGAFIGANFNIAEWDILIRVLVALFALATLIGTMAMHRTEQSKKGKR